MGKFYNANSIDIRRAILNNIQTGMDTREGSFAATLAGAVATQIADLYFAIDTMTCRFDPMLADSEALEDLGRTMGLYIRSSTQCVASFVCVEGTVDTGTRLTDGKLEYTVLYAESGGTRGYAQSVTRGSSANDISVDTLIESGTVKFKFLSIVQYARDEETVEEFRTRVSQAGMVVPYSGNVAWFQSVVGDVGGVGFVRVQRPTYRTSPHSGVVVSTVEIYVADPSMHGISQYLCDVIQKQLDDVVPVGMHYQIYPTKTPTGLKWKIDVKLGRNVASVDDLKPNLVQRLKDHVAELCWATLPEHRVVLSPLELGAHLMATMYPSVEQVTCTITRDTTEYTTDPVVFRMNELPIVTDENVAVGAK